MGVRLFGQIRNKVFGSKLIGSFFVTVIGSGISKFLMIISTFVCTHYLTLTEFGEFSFIRNTLTMILTICALNFSSLCTKFTSEIKKSEDSLYKLILLFFFSFLMCLIAGLLLLLLPADFLKGLLGENKNVIVYFRIAGLLIPLFMLQPLIEGVMRGMMLFKLIGVTQVFSSLLYIITVIGGIKIKGINGAIYGLYTYYLIYSVSLFFLVMKQNNIKSLNFLNYTAIVDVIPVLYKLIIPVFIISFVEAPVFWYLQALLTKYSDISSVGCMTVMKQIRNFAVLIPNYFFNTYLAFAAALVADKKYNDYFKQLNKIIRIFSIIGICLFLLFTFCGKYILGLYGDEYAEKFSSLIYSNACIPLVMIISLIKTELILQEHQRYLLFVSIVWNLLWVVIFYILVKASFKVLDSFFIAELVSVFVNLVLIYIVYRIDKVKLVCKRII